jgi:hypothetical protein
MSIPASTAPAVMAYLVAGVQAAPEMPATLLGSPVLVSYGIPGTYNTPAAIAVGTRITATARMEQLVGSGGPGWLYENYQLEVMVEAFLGGDDPQSVEQAAYSLWQVVADVVRDDPQLGGLVIVAYPSKWESVSSWDPNHKGRVCQITGEIDVEAQL